MKSRTAPTLTRRVFRTLRRDSVDAPQEGFSGCTSRGIQWMHLFLNGHPKITGTHTNGSVCRGANKCRHAVHNYDTLINICVNQQVPSGSSGSPACLRTPGGWRPSAHPHSAYDGAHREPQQHGPCRSANRGKSQSRPQPQSLATAAPKICLSLLPSPPAPFLILFLLISLPT